MNSMPASAIAISVCPLCGGAKSKTSFEAECFLLKAPGKKNLFGNGSVARHYLQLVSEREKKETSFGFSAKVPLNIHTMTRKILKVIKVCLYFSISPSNVLVLITQSRYQYSPSSPPMRLF